MMVMKTITMRRRRMKSMMVMMTWRGMVAWSGVRKEFQ